jgi:hypothetical protein
MAATTTKPARPGAALADRFTVVVLAIAAVLAVLALLAWQMRSTAAAQTHPIVLLRRVYQTRVIETVVGGPRGGASVSQSVSSSGTGSALPAAPVTSSSGVR